MFQTATITEMRFNSKDIFKKGKKGPVWIFVRGKKQGVYIDANTFEKMQLNTTSPPQSKWEKQLLDFEKNSKKTGSNLKKLTQYKFSKQKNLSKKIDDIYQ